MYRDTYIKMYKEYEAKHGIITDLDLNSLPFYICVGFFFVQHSMAPMHQLRVKYGANLISMELKQKVEVILKSLGE